MLRSTNRLKIKWARSGRIGCWLISTHSHPTPTPCYYLNLVSNPALTCLKCGQNGMERVYQSDYRDSSTTKLKRKKRRRQKIDAFIHQELVMYKSHGFHEGKKTTKGKKKETKREKRLKGTKRPRNDLFPNSNNFWNIVKFADYVVPSNITPSPPV